MLARFDRFPRGRHPNRVKGGMMKKLGQLVGSGLAALALMHLYFVYTYAT